ncbi:MAG: hypothetical protein K0U47_12330 [Epsilonproteobacteria bacterium]|nr:hypothetical protein [Campylobacterota bacterium]
MLQNYKEIMDRSKSQVTVLAEDVYTAFERSCEAFANDDIEKATEAKKMMKDAHNQSNKIDNEIIKTLALFSPEAKDLRVLIAYLKITNELTRISDYIRGHAKHIKMQISGEVDLTLLKNNAISFHESTKKSLRAAVDSIHSTDIERLEHIHRVVNVEESKCDDIFSILEKSLLEQICVLPEQASDFIRFLDSMRKLERISDRSVDIVKLSFYAQKGGKIKI